MKKILPIAFLLAAFSINAQETTAEVVDTTWTDTLKVGIIFNQSAFNAEWMGGGTSSIAGDVNMVYNLNYNTDKWIWDSRFAAIYGLTKLEESEFLRKTSDRLEIHSTVARAITNSNWNFSFFTNFRTQFTKGYQYAENQLGEEIRTEYTRFFSPAYLQAGPGLLWKKNDNLKINFAPATARLIFVNDKFTTIPGYEDGAYFGLDEGSTTRFEFGASVAAYAQFELMKNVNMEHILSLYSNYLEDPQNVDIDYTLNMVMNINKYLSTSLVFQAIYDDNAVGAFQIREVFGLAVTFVR